MIAGASPETMAAKEKKDNSGRIAGIKERDRNTGDQKMKFDLIGIAG